jgi:putative alpha-1,2-mannosidase
MNLPFVPLCLSTLLWACPAALPLPAADRLEVDPFIGTAAHGHTYPGAALNGKPYFKSFLHDADIQAGGELELVMGATPNTRWGVGPTPFSHETGAKPPWG